MKNKKLSIRISEQDLTAIHRKAVTAKLSFTDYVTRSCLNRQIVVIDGLEDIIREQKAIGRNLNRLTLLCNMGKVSVHSVRQFSTSSAKYGFACVFREAIHGRVKNWLLNRRSVRKTGVQERTEVTFAVPSRTQTAQFFSLKINACEIHENFHCKPNALHRTVIYRNVKPLH